jgi:hypothetical protein
VENEADTRVRCTFLLIFAFVGYVVQMAITLVVRSWGDFFGTFAAPDKGGSRIVGNVQYYIANYLILALSGLMLTPIVPLGGVVAHAACRLRDNDSGESASS